MLDDSIIVMTIMASDFLNAIQEFLNNRKMWHLWNSKPKKEKEKKTFMLM